MKYLDFTTKKTVDDSTSELEEELVLNNFSGESCSDLTSVYFSSIDEKQGKRYEAEKEIMLHCTKCKGTSFSKNIKALPHKYIAVKCHDCKTIIKISAKNLLGIRAEPV